MTAFYAAWKYAQVWPSDAAGLYDRMKPKLTLPCPFSSSELTSSAQMANAYIAGYYGFLELEKLAGRPESAAVRSEYTRLVNLRLAGFSIDAPWTGWDSGSGFNQNRNFIMARHFLYLVPELAEALRSSKLPEVRTALGRINAVTPYWFVEGSRCHPRRRDPSAVVRCRHVQRLRDDSQGRISGVAQVPGRTGVPGRRPVLHPQPRVRAGGRWSPRGATIRAHERAHHSMRC